MVDISPDLWKLAVSQGIFAVLFIVLLLYVLRTQEKRDKRAERREDELVGALKESHATNQQYALAVQKLADSVEGIEKRLAYRNREESY